MEYTKKIGWQKYEALLEEQINSPILSEMMNKLKEAYSLDNSLQTDDDVLEYTEDQEEETAHGNIMIPITADMIKDINLLTTFDCWIGHTNFDITTDVQQKLDKIMGVEALKIYSRYRFFLGVGKMFDFKNVRSEIEQQLTKE